MSSVVTKVTGFPGMGRMRYEPPAALIIVGFQFRFRVKRLVKVVADFCVQKQSRLKYAD